MGVSDFFKKHLHNSETSKPIEPRISIPTDSIKKSLPLLIKPKGNKYLETTIKIDLSPESIMKMLVEPSKKQKIINHKQALSFIKDRILKIDISFITEDKVPENVKALAQLEMISPYNDDNLIFKVADKDMQLAKKVPNYTRNYDIFTDELEKFATKERDNGDLELACEIYKYLIELNYKSVRVKENLLKIYINEKNENGIKWVGEQIEKQLFDKKDYHQCHENLWALKVKYSNELGGFEKIFTEMNQALLSTPVIREISKLYEKMSELFFKYKRIDDALIAGLHSYYMYIHYCNIEPYDSPEKYYEDFCIEHAVKKLLKKAKLPNKQKDFVSLLKDYIYQYPNAEMKTLKTRVPEIIAK